MHKQLFRLFLSISCILLLTFAVQMAFLSVFSQRVVGTWTEVVFDEFAESLRNYVDNIDENPADSFFGFLTSSTSERVSGFLLRSSDSSQILPIGRSGRGNYVSQLNTFSSGGYTYIDVATSRDKTRNGSNTYILSAPKYRLDIYTTDPFSMVVEKGEFTETNDKGKVSVTYPDTIDRKDIAGTIEIYINDVLFANLDVLVYSVRYYTPTALILSKTFKAIYISIPIALFVALLFAFRVSKRTERNVKALKKAVGELSEGDFDVVLPKFKIQEYKEIGASVEKLGKDLKRHSASRKEWIRNISHDLNTPVTSMNMLLEGAEDGMFPINEALISSVKNECDVLKSRIASVAYYSYLLSPDAKCEKVECSLSDTSDMVLQSLHLDAKVSFPEGETVLGDPTLLQRAFTEVLKNAREYGDKHSDIVWRSVREEGALKLVVSNRGQLPNPRPLFFEPWARGDASRTSGGSGLGLPIVYQIMDMHGGTVSIDEKNGNVEVVLTFPLQ